MKTLIFDIYGVIIKESKGNFLPYTYSCFPESEHDRITALFRVEKLFTKASNGEITSNEFLEKIGFSDPNFHMREYIDEHLTLDKKFYSFADSFYNTYNFALLSNDVSDWSKYLTLHYDLNKYFQVKIISANVHCRKPDPKIFDIMLQRLGVPASSCICIDNDPENLKTASSLGMDTILFNRDYEDYDGKIACSFDELSRIL